MTLIERMLSHDSDSRPALRFEGESKWYSYGQLFREAEGYAGFLRTKGVERNSLVVIQAEASLDLVLWHLACMAIGATRLALHPKKTFAEIQAIIEMAKPTHAITCQPTSFGPGIQTFTQLRRESASVADWPADQEGTYLFTSGSTGRPNGVRRNLTALLNNFLALESRWGLSEHDVLCNRLSLDHAHGWELGVNAVLARGARVVIAPRFAPVAPPKECNMIYAVPAMWIKYLQHALTLDPKSFQNMVLLVSGSDYLPPEVALAVQQITGFTLLNRWGMTEGPPIFTAHYRFSSWNPYSVGTALKGVQLQVAEDGELLALTTPPFLGYTPPTNPSGLLPGGWIPTGDFGRISDGQVYIVGRKKDIIIRGGENIAPAEIEYVIEQVPGVERAGCYARPDETYGEIVGAAIMVASGYDESRVLAVCKQAVEASLTKPKWPVDWQVLAVGEFPLTSVGKVSRSALRERFCGKR